MTANKVIVAGHGQMGHAMEALLAQRAELVIWPISPADLEPPAAVRAAAAEADFLLICTPTVAHAAVLHGLAYLLRPGTALLSIAKGLDEIGRCAAEILQGHWDGRSWGVLGGPMIANEIIVGRPAFAALGSHDTELLARTRDLYPRPGLSIAGIYHPQTISWCGVLKNVYAPLVGVSDELGWGENARGHIVMAALREMHSILGELTGDEMQVYADAGLADFVTTVTSPNSHHYALGRRIARGDFQNLECEGVHSLRVLRSRDHIASGKHRLLEIVTHLVEDRSRLVPALHNWLTSA